MKILPKVYHQKNHMLTQHCLFQLLTTLFLHVTVHINAEPITTFVPNGEYRIYNVRQGFCRSLAISDDGSIRLVMAKSKHVDQQIWTLRFNENAAVVAIVPTLFQNQRISNDGKSMFPTLAKIELLQEERNLKIQSLDEGNIEIKKVLLPVDSGLDPISDFTSAFLIAIDDEQRNRDDAGDKLYLAVDDGTSPNVVLQMGHSEANDSSELWIFDTIEQISFPPYHIDVIYEKFIDFWGLPIISSKRVSDEVLYHAYFILRHMLSKIVLSKKFVKLSERKIKIAVVGAEEDAIVLPEVLQNSGHRNGRYNSDRLGETAENEPFILIPEEHLMCLNNDPHPGQDKFVEVIANAVLSEFLMTSFPAISKNFNSLRQSAVVDEDKWSKCGLRHDFDNEFQRYFVGGSKIWFNANGYSRPPDGKFNHVATRDSLYAYDRGLYRGLAKLYPNDDNKCVCH